MIPINVHDRAVALYWPSSAAGAQRLTADACGVTVRFIELAPRGCGCVLAITRGWRPAANACGVTVRFIEPAPRGCGCVLAITRGLRPAAHGRRLRRNSSFH